MINFAQPQYLLLIFLIPLFFAAYALMLHFRKRRLRRFGDGALVSGLMPSVSSAKGWVRITLFSLAFFFFAIGLSRPQIGAKLKEHKTKGVEIMIALDVSNSMLAEDFAWTGIGVVSPEDPRGVPADQMARDFKRWTACPVRVYREAREALADMRALAGDELLFCTGSLYLAGDVRRILKEEEQ